MQTFLPWPDFNDSARALDDRRLGKQIIEARQLFRTLTGITGGWRNHPATGMWRGHEMPLVGYAVACNDEWKRRHLRQHGAHRNLFEIDVPRVDPQTLGFSPPPWLGDPEFHRRHRLRLLYVKPDWYTHRFPEPVPDTPPDYLWPKGAAA